MRFNAPPTMRVIKKEEKEARLKDLISNHIRSSAETGTAATMHLVVRSHESPVVRALTALAGDLAAARIALEVVVSLPGADDAVTWPDELAAISQCRTVRDVRLLDAHEQLWLDAETVWIGDCMRREPTKRDAYECYGLGCRATAASVLTSFRSFWSKSAAATRSGLAAAVEPAAAEIDPAMMSVPGTEQSPPPTAMTRH
jgi:hypothetical protein